MQHLGDGGTQLSDELLYVEVAAIGLEECITIYGRAIKENAICARANNTSGICKVSDAM